MYKLKKRGDLSAIAYRKPCKKLWEQKDVFAHKEWQDNFLKYSMSVGHVGLATCHETYSWIDSNDGLMCFNLLNIPIFLSINCSSKPFTTAVFNICSYWKFGFQNNHLVGSILLI